MAVLLEMQKRSEGVERREELDPEVARGRFGFEALATNVV